MEKNMQGVRKDFDDSYILKSGEYGQLNRIWYATPPGTDLMANLANHTVIEHEDKTITVSPSILVWDHNTRWHGFLEKGVWRKL